MFSFVYFVEYLISFFSFKIHSFCGFMIMKRVNFIKCQFTCFIIENHLINCIAIKSTTHSNSCPFYVVEWTMRYRKQERYIAHQFDKGINNAVKFRALFKMLWQIFSSTKILQLIWKQWFFDVVLCQLNINCWKMHPNKQLEPIEIEIKIQESVINQKQTNGNTKKENNTNQLELSIKYAKYFEMKIFLSIFR